MQHSWELLNLCEITTIEIYARDATHAKICNL